MKVNFIDEPFRSLKAVVYRPIFAWQRENQKSYSYRSVIHTKKFTITKIKNIHICIIIFA